MKSHRLYWLMALWAVSIATQLLLPTTMFFIQASVVIIILLLMTLFKSSVNFLIFLSTILVYGFCLTVYSMNHQIFDAGQYELILAHLLLTASILLNWLIVHELKTLNQKIQEMEVRLNQLEKIDNETKALSFPEFLERGLLIETGMRRRGEKGYLLYFTMTDIVPLTVKSSLRQEFIKACLHTVRAGYDLVTSPTDEEILIFLQATDEAGRDIVIHRIEEAMKQNVNCISMPFSIHSWEVENLEEKLDELMNRKGA